jgi:hypothetical protein
LSYDDTFLSAMPDQWLKDGEKDSNVQLTANSFRINMLGKNVENPLGESFTYSKSFKTKQLGEQSQSKDVNFIATACYEYHTKKGIPICIDTVPFSKSKKACETKPITLSSQGGPLVITKVEPKIIPQGNSFQLEVYVYKKSQTDIACGEKFPAATEKFWNILEENDVNLMLSTETGSDQFKCDSFPIKVSEKEDASIRCVYNNLISATSPYTTTLFVDLSYGYTQSASTKMKILSRNYVK